MPYEAGLGSAQEAETLFTGAGVVGFVPLARAASAVTVAKLALARAALALAVARLAFARAASVAAAALLAFTRATSADPRRRTIFAITSVVRAPPSGRNSL